MSDQLQSSIVTIVTVIIANWAVIFPIVKKAIVTAWEKSIEFRDLKVETEQLKLRVNKLEKDIQAAHDKIRKHIF